ncbi:DUF58 domain-containing protein [Haloferax massiliensis]|uniref:DUF58 domain-containing protein n=1 Tax=Haloferax massiliensis TaxID=1476858 RepID=A0A0D6JVE9_9EURY|nr:DUF58 domain-containing protein [Haloferax massiliensis]CQR52974.1 hypothetical protein BN996_03395 [Haloferax massiliensis]
MTTPQETNRWRGVVAVSLVVAAGGLLAQRQELLFLSTVGIVFAAYHRVVPTPTPELTLERRVDTSSPAEGDEVEIEVAVTNEGDATLYDCRIVDGVPPALSVTDGPARSGMVLRPGDTRTFSYAVEAEHGRHAFDDATAVVRDASGDREVEVDVRAADETELDCTAEITEPPLRSQTLDTVGGVTANGMGSGIEFQQTRSYRRGDPVSQIDWKRYASSGELTTIDFREEQAASILVLVDARAVAYRGPPGETHAVDAGVSAAAQLTASLLKGRNRVGLAALAAEDCFQLPGVGREHRLRLRKLLSRHSAFSAKPTDADQSVDAQVESYLGRLGEQTQLLFVSPVCDDLAVEVARRFDSHGHPVTVVSPDVTADETPGERLAVAERRNRLRSLRQVGIPAIEWSLDDPLALAIDTQRGVRI